MSNQQWVELETKDLSGAIIGCKVHATFDDGHEIIGTLVGIRHRARPAEANSSNRADTTLRIDLAGRTVKVDFFEAAKVRLLNWPQVL